MPSTDKILYIVSRTVSFVFSPLLVPTYGILLAFCLSFLVILPTQTKLVVTLTTFLMTGIMPFATILLLWKSKRISEPSLRARAERKWPYIITTICYLANVAYLIFLKAPSWLWAFMLGASISLLIVMAINSRWKISAHTTAMGGLVAMLFRIAVCGYNPMPIDGVLTATILLTGMVGTARLLLQRHTLSQVLAGFVVGFIPVYLISLI